MTTLAYRTDAEVRAAIPQVVAHLHAGGLLAYPTETVYGVGSRAREADVRALAELKGRRGDKPFLLLVSDRAMAEAQTSVSLRNQTAKRLTGVNSARLIEPESELKSGYALQQQQHTRERTIRREP